MWNITMHDVLLTYSHFFIGFEVMSIFFKNLLSNLKIRRPDMKFSANKKNFFGWIFFLNSCENLQVRPQINGFHCKRNFSLGILAAWCAVHENMKNGGDQINMLEWLVIFFLTISNWFTWGWRIATSRTSTKFFRCTTSFSAGFCWQVKFAKPAWKYQNWTHRFYKAT